VRIGRSGAFLFFLLKKSTHNWHSSSLMGSMGLQLGSGAALALEQNDVVRRVGNSPC
jgi:hypothetical protein